MSAAQTVRLSLLEIREDDTVRARGKLDEGVVKTYADAYVLDESMPPVVVFYDGTHYWLADGFHRLAALRLEGETDVDAEVHSGSQRAAILFACGANATHGLPRSREDKHLAVKKLLDDGEWRLWSNHAIARACAVSHTFVGTIRKNITGHVSSERSYMTKHGTTAVMDTTKIGKRKPLVAGHAPAEAKSPSTAPEPSSDEAERTSAPDAVLVARAPAMEDGTNVAIVPVAEVRRVLGEHADGKLRIVLDFQPGSGICAKLSWLDAIDSDPAGVPGVTAP